MYTYKIKIDRIIDGDTIDVIIDLGFKIYINKRIRMYGINAAETRTKNLVEKAKGMEAKKWLIKFLKNKELNLLTEKDASGKYGRVLGTIFAAGVNVNKEMIDLKLASEYYGKSKVR